eukprot:588845-Rhodomonas_salina.1
MPCPVPNSAMVLLNAAMVLPNSAMVVRAYQLSCTVQPTPYPASTDLGYDLGCGIHPAPHSIPMRCTAKLLRHIKYYCATVPAYATSGTDLCYGATGIPALVHPAAHAVANLTAENKAWAQQENNANSGSFSAGLTDIWLKRRTTRKQHGNKRGVCGTEIAYGATQSAGMLLPAARPRRATPPPPPTRHPTPCSGTTLHPTLYTLRPTPYNLQPTPYALRPTPYTLHPTPKAPDPRYWTLDPRP